MFSAATVVNPASPPPLSRSDDQYSSNSDSDVRYSTERAELPRACPLFSPTSPYDRAIPPSEPDRPQRRRRRPHPPTERKYRHTVTNRESPCERPRRPVLALASIRNALTAGSRPRHARRAVPSSLKFVTGLTACSASTRTNVELPPSEDGARRGNRERALGIGIDAVLGAGRREGPRGRGKRTASGRRPLLQCCSARSAPYAWTGRGYCRRCLHLPYHATGVRRRSGAESPFCHWAPFVVVGSPSQQSSSL
jgi:hypothetical protein